MCFYDKQCYANAMVCMGLQYFAMVCDSLN